MKSEDKYAFEKYEEIGSGKWLTLEKIHFRDKNSRPREWESVRRNNCPGAVVMIVELKPGGELILIKQYRPPASSYVIEFPAGLMDKDEAPESTAVRELKEETGYKGKVLKLLPASYNSPGLTSETVYIALMEADLTLPENRNIVPEREEHEDIEVITVRKDKLADFLEASQGEGISIDSKVLSYALGMKVF